MLKRHKEMKEEVRENMRGGKGNVRIRHYFTKDEFASNTRLCAQLTIPPGGSIGSHQHEGEDEVYIIEKGIGLLEEGDRQFRVSPGDAVLTGRGMSHAVSNNGSEDLVMIAVIMCY